jgi:hypothetical protein
MLTATAPNAFNFFPNAQFSQRVNPETSFTMYTRYRDMAMGLIDTNSPEIFYRVFNNAVDSYNGEGIHRSSSTEVNRCWTFRWVV